MFTKDELNNLKKLTSSIKDTEYDVEKIKKELKPVLQEFKHAYSMCLESEKNSVFQLPSDLEYLSNEARKAISKVHAVINKYKIN